MRITGGQYSGLHIDSLKGAHTRPTTDRVKAALFNSLNFRIKNKGVFVDLFSGSGAIGLEALSWGFQKVYFIDNFKPAIDMINKNLAKIEPKQQTKTKVIKSDYQKGLDMIKENVDVLFIDPPYHKADFDQIIKAAMQLQYNKDAILVVESDYKTDLKEDYNNFLKFQEKKYGNTKLTYYRKED